VRTVGVGGGGERIVTRTHTGRAHPDFSPNCRSLGFVDRAGGRWGIFTVRADGVKRRLARRVGQATAPQWTRNR
jgi:hypothetical protein